MNTTSALSVAPSGSATQVQEQICKAVVAEASRYFGERLQTVILTGSMARDEATFQTCASGNEVLGDAEFVLVFRDLPERSALDRFILAAQNACAAERITCKIDCSAVRPSYFRSLHPSIYTYELLNCGRVCAGDGRALAAAPRFSSNSIPHEDGWRMLCNRLIELLEVLPEEGVSPMTSEADYRALKLKLDLATSILVYAGLYLPGYGERARIFREHCCELSSRVGIDLAQFTGELEDCTRAKLGRASIPHCDRVRLQGIVRLALDVCSWEMQQMFGASTSLAETEKLMQTWISRQSVHGRLRGWAYVARGQGWLAIWKQWPRWSWMALTGSPRYWIYAAALRAARQFTSEETCKDAPQAYDLPLGPIALRSQASRQEIARNYRACVAGTSS